MSRTLVLGASNNPQRMSNVAMLKLKQNGITVVAIGNRVGVAHGIEITKEFQFLISSKVKTQSEDNIKRLSDPTGNSTWSYYAFYLTDGGVAQVFCTDWSEELLKSKNYVDELKTGLYSVEFRNFLANE